MNIKKNILLVATISFFGCSSESNIWVKLCNHTQTNIDNIVLLWNQEHYTIKQIDRGKCKKVKLFNLKGESALWIKIKKKKYPIDVYFESENYRGTININLEKNNIKTENNITLK